MNNVSREFYEVEGAADILGITVNDLWHLIEIDRIYASFRQVITDATFDFNERSFIEDLMVCHTFLIPKNVAKVIAVKGSCVTKVAFLHLAEPEEKVFLDLYEGECIGFSDKYELQLDKEMELHKGDVVITKRSIDEYIARYPKLLGDENFQIQSKPLGDKERETMVKIIHALAKNGYKYPQRGTLTDILKDFELNENGVSENTLTKYLKEFDNL